MGSIVISEHVGCVAVNDRTCLIGAIGGAQLCGLLVGLCDWAELIEFANSYDLIGVAACVDHTDII